MLDAEHRAAGADFSRRQSPAIPASHGKKHGKREKYADFFCQPPQLLYLCGRSLRSGTPDGCGDGSLLG